MSEKEKERVNNPSKKIKKDTEKQGNNYNKNEKQSSSKDKKLPRFITSKSSSKQASVFSLNFSLWNVLIAGMLCYLIFLAFGVVGNNEEKPTEASLSTIASDIKEGEISKIEVDGHEVRATYRDGTLKEARKEASTSFIETLSEYGVSLQTATSVEYIVKKPGGFEVWGGLIASLAFPLLMLLILVWMFTRAKGQGMQALTFGRSRARIIDPEDQQRRITFNDVAGAKEAKQELMEIVDFLKNPKKFIDIGAQIPKGVLLMGAPGTGKTLIARAVAGEAGVPFFSISGSEFVEMFVGVGASRVRDLFDMAKRTAPSIIFVDEIDAVGRMRGGGTGGGNDEREQTLNQILVEMDGFEPNEKVIIMAATNRPDVLDNALLRPGRFDRRVTIDLPDLEDRIEILTIQVRNKPLADGVDLRRIAERTPGFSGAEIYSLVNEAAILAARNDRKIIEQVDFINAIEKVILGPERRSHLLLPDEKKVTAYHEAGHALVASVLPHTDPVHKITIVSRGRAMGYVLHLPLEERKFKSKKQFIDDLAVTLAGYATEKIIFGDVSTGPSNDLEVATNRARDMVTKYGMSDEIGPIALANEVGKPLYGMFPGSDSYSEEVAAKIDREVAELLRDAEKSATDAITKHSKLLKEIADKLIKEETIEREDFEKLLLDSGIEPKRLSISEELSS